MGVEVREAVPGTREYRVFRALSYYMFGERGSVGEPIRLLGLRGGAPCGLLHAVASPNYLHVVEEETGMKVAHLRGVAVLCPGDRECLDALLEALRDALRRRGLGGAVAFRDLGLPGMERRVGERRGRRRVEYWLLRAGEPVQAAGRR